MYREINKEIYELKDKMRLKEKVVTLRAIAEDDLRNKREDLELLGIMLQKEENDVLKLESMSLSSFFLNLTGKKEEKLDKEKREYLSAKMRYDECVLAIKELEEEIRRYDEELKQYSATQDEYHQAIDHKKEQLISEDSIEGKRLADALDRINDLRLDIKEIEEAIDAGNDAKKALLSMKEPLESAKGWGVWDMIGGGFFSDLMKHSKIDEANRLSYDVQNALRRFKKELEDVNNYTDIEVNIGSFAKFADFFFDGLFADWFVQSKINDSISNVKNAINKLTTVISNLKGNLVILEEEQSRLESEVNKLLQI